MSVESIEYLDDVAEQQFKRALVELFSKEFLGFFEHRGKAIRIEVMKEVRDLAQSQAVHEIAAKLKVLVSAKNDLDRQSDHRRHKPMER